MGSVIGHPDDDGFDLTLPTTLRKREKLAVGNELSGDRRAIHHTGTPQSVNQV